MTEAPATIRVHRVYDPPDPNDGYRVLVDRMWPRGVSERASAWDEWCRDVAPSAELRRWYDHDPKRFRGFRECYLAELDAPARATALARLRAHVDARLTLLTATDDLSFSHARILAERLCWGRAHNQPAVTYVHLDETGPSPRR
jgi:uncharacterized protein YeaO (DUF488 family)